MRLAFLSLVLALLVAACGGGTDRTKAQVRLVNASPSYATLDMRVDDQLRQASPYGGSDGYVEVEPGKAGTQITSSGSATPLLSFTPALSENRYYTVLAYGEAGALRQQVLDDNTGEPADNRALLRVVNAASNAGALDVYLTAASDALGTAVPVQAGAAYGAASGWITVNSGTWRLRVTAAGDSSDLRLDVPAVSLPNKHITTLVITPGGGGVLVNGLLLAQRSGITRADATQARVRLAAGVTANATVAATVGTERLAAGQSSPSIASYALVPAGAQSVAVAVNGSALPASSFTLEAGRDYTLLVQGTPGAARASWVSDDNRLPTDSSKAKLRLVNGLAETGQTLSMTVDLLPAAGGVANGSGSAYATLTPTAGNGDGALAVVALAGGSSSPVYAASDQLLAAGRVYSVFVLGAQGSATGVLRRDR
jgi:hypothetical protein